MRLLERRAPESLASFRVQPRSSTKMVDGAAHKSGESGLPFLLDPEQSKAKRKRERGRKKETKRERRERERERERKRERRKRTLQ